MITMIKNYKEYQGLQKIQLPIHSPSFCRWCWTGVQMNYTEITAHIHVTYQKSAKTNKPIYNSFQTCNKSVHDSYIKKRSWALIEDLQRGQSKYSVNGCIDCKPTLRLSLLSDQFTISKLNNTESSFYTKHTKSATIKPWLCMAVQMCLVSSI